MALKTKFRIIVLVIPFAIVFISWGKFGHEHINHAAVMALPMPMQTFYYNHIDYITQESNEPDIRKYTLSDTAEYPRHFIHLEVLGNLDTVPKSPAAALKKYDHKFFIKHGMLPWAIEDMMAKLTDALKHKHKTDILFLSADLAHYIGDAYMPLHVSTNHNGTLTNAKGAHSLFESQLPEVFGETYNYNVGGKVKYVADIEKETWRILSASLKSADTLLKVDRDLSKTLPKDKIYVLDASGNIKTNEYNEPVHTYQYLKLYHDGLKGMVERQMRYAIASSASFWYTAWVNAGKPDLNSLDKKELTTRNAPSLAQERALYKKGKLFGLKAEKEF